MVQARRDHCDQGWMLKRAIDPQWRANQSAVAGQPHSDPHMMTIEPMGSESKFFKLRVHARASRVLGGTLGSRRAHVRGTKNKRVIN